MTGDFNSVVDEIDATRHFSAKLSKVFRQLVNQAQFSDCFRTLHPAVREFTFHRAAHMAQSRLDRVYALPHLADKIETICYKAGISDHCRVEVILNIATGHWPEQKKVSPVWFLETEHFSPR